MRLSQSTNWSNTTIVGNVTYRDVGAYGISIALGIALFVTPLFKWNWPAMIAYVAFVSIIVGRTPTRRTVLLNLYNILFKKKVRMVVSDLTTNTTIGHGIREVIIDQDIDMPIFKMNDGHYCYVYNITSGINRWSTINDYETQAIMVKKIFKVFEGGEQLFIVTKNDMDTGMLQLRDALAKDSNFDPEKDPDIANMAQTRLTLLERVATQENGRSVQQYAILKIKKKNFNRCFKALQHSCRLIRPASNPIDIMLSAMGLEGGIEQRDEVDR